MYQILEQFEINVMCSIGDLFIQDSAVMFIIIMGLMITDDVDENIFIETIPHTTQFF